MIETIEQMIAQPPASRVALRGTWVLINDFLKDEVAGGASQSSSAKTRSGAAALLRAVRLTAENAPLDLPWFDQTFPRGGWTIDMPIERATYDDARHRVRPVIERITGAAAVRQQLRATQDEWTALAAFLKNLEQFKGSNGAQKLIPVVSTLTMAARRANAQPRDVDQTMLQMFYVEARKGEIGSLRRASRLVATLQETTPDILRWLPNPITPIEAEGAFQYDVPDQFRHEVEEFVEHASRRKYVRAKRRHKYVSDGARINFRTTMHGVVHGLLAAGRLRRNANGFAPVLTDPDALEDLVDHVSCRVEAGEIGARHATNLMARLPVILDRNGIDSTHLRGILREVDELQHFASKAEMPMAAMRLCRKLIESKPVRTKFLLAHARPRQVAQGVLDAAGSAGRRLTASERMTVIRHGVVALFCAIEIGGAPVRVENVLEMPYGGKGAWIWPENLGFEVVIPGGHVKNGHEIRFQMQPTAHKWSDTVQWYLEHVRPLILRGPEADEIRASPWLVPMLTDAGRPCPYETFLGWFTRITRDVVGVPCLPHNFRHGQASLLYHRYPERIGWIAKRLGDTEATVLHCYAWVHNEKAMAEGQQLICDMIDE